jgi:hypothetical protein
MSRAYWPRPGRSAGIIDHRQHRHRQRQDGLAHHLDDGLGVRVVGLVVLAEEALADAAGGDREAVGP